MNAVEIEQAVSELAEQPFDTEEFPYVFLMGFGNKDRDDVVDPPAVRLREGQDQRRVTSTWRWLPRLAPGSFASGNAV